MKNKVIAMLVLVSMLSAMLIPAYAEETVTFAFYETFDSYPTNDQPGKGVFIAEESRVVDITPDNKGYLLKSGGSYGVIDAGYDGIGQSGSFVFSADLYIEGDTPSGAVTITDTAGKTADLFTISSDGLGITGGYKVDGYRKNEKISLAICYNAKTTLASIYVNNRLSVENWFVKNLINGISKINFRFNVGTGKESSVILDNIYVYGGGRLVDASSLPKEVYNSSIVEYEEPVQEDNVFFYREFGETGFTPFDKIGDHSGDNTAEIVKDDTGNSYMKLEKTTSTNLVMDMNPISYTGMNVKAQNERYAIFQCDVSGNAFGSSGNLLAVEGPLASGTTLVGLSDNRLSAGGQVIATLKQGEWITVSAAVDFIKGVYDVYIDYKPVVTGLKLNEKTKYYARWRLILPAAASNGDVYVDNLCVYNGQDVRPITFEEGYKEISNVTADTDSLKLLKSFDVINYKSDYAVINKEKKKIEDIGFEDENGDVYVNAKAVAEIYGKSYSESNGTAVADGKNVSGTITSDGVIYAPYSSYMVNYMGRNCLLDDRGIILISLNPIDSNIYGYEKENNLWDIVNYTMYDRPEPDELVSKLNDQHPRIIFSAEDVARVKAELPVYATKKKALDAIITSANGYLTTEPLEYDLSTGTILLAARKSLQRAIALGIAYTFTEKEEYAERAWKEAEKICDYPDFHPDHFLDTGELSATLAIIYDWCYDYLSKDSAKLKKIEEKILKDCVNIGIRAYCYQAGVNWVHWVNASMNQNPVNSGGLLMAATAVMDVYPERCSQLVSLAVKAMEAYTKCFYPSGAYSESTTYYSYGMGYWARAIGTLRSAFGTEFNLSLAPMMRESTEYMLATTSYVANNNYHDTEDSNLLGAVGMFDFLAHEYGDESLYGVKNYVYDYYGSSSTDMNYLFYGKETESTEITSPADMYLRSLELVSLRSAWTEPDGAFVSAHAGAAFPGHGHVDTGTFVIDMLGTRFANDLGSEDYNYLSEVASKEGVRDGKPYAYATRPEGHNCVVINPRYDSGHNLEAFAPITDFKTGNKNSFAIADLSETYNEDVTSYQRGYYLGDDRRSVMIRDEIALRSDSELYWFMNTTADITFESDTVAVLDIEGKRVKAKLLTNIEGAKFSEMEAKPLETSPNYVYNDYSKYKKLTVHAPKASGNVYIQVKIIPASDGNANAEEVNMPMSSWMILEGEREELPVVSTLSADGVMLGGFNENVYNYVINIPESRTDAPQIAAETAEEQVTIEVTQAESVDEAATVLVTDSETSLSSIYSVTFNKIPKMPDVGEYERLQVYNISASSVPQAQNGPDNVNDNDLSTRYAVEGGGEWVMQDLGSEVDIEAIALAVYYGDSRKNFFEIEVSNDGENYTKVYSGESSGTTTDIEVIDITDVKARYIRYVTLGSTAGTWNSVTEFGALRKR